MNWSIFVVVVSGLITLVTLLIALPWLRKRKVDKRDTLTNIAVIKQRLEELEREAEEGLIGDAEKQKASDELKLALVDESSPQRRQQKQSAFPALLVGGALAFVTGGIVYFTVNHLNQIEQAQSAISALPELSEKLASGNASNFTANDISALTYAIRQRLRETPEDATGWMFLSRLWLSVGETTQATQAIEKAMAIKPTDSTIQITYAQALMASNTEEALLAAQSVLTNLLKQNQENDNLVLMMAVVSARLGDLDNTRTYFAKVRDKLPEDNETRLGLEQRLSELEALSSATPTPSSTISATGFDMQITLDEALKNKVPTEGFLIVYAQDGNSDNRMPAAVVKMPLQTFPVTLTLTTENAMLPSYTLSSLSQAKLVARISADEDVMPATGDLLGEMTVTVSQGEVLSTKLEINEEIM
ncbi:c-type cytochrome biogenesis protein CcmI [Alteromonas sp. C1M14]|uniref:c-type cytochrome biogenesis protein CcmI n=1 Tax=Alteromonas sp. C1M14 TaxID=2841567 RepID=UPI001C08CA05|nr:c-type cytochrome biogenesis protein CcmI [Alteromonas sp. C1M14]MBU2977823.1 c-type cytochrome biogenesis protein CcmI [Alteromonas sp. C1M14]